GAEADSVAPGALDSRRVPDTSSARSRDTGPRRGGWRTLRLGRDPRSVARVARGAQRHVPQGEGLAVKAGAVGRRGGGGGAGSRSRGPARGRHKGAHSLVAAGAL